MVTDAKIEKIKRRNRRDVEETKNNLQEDPRRIKERGKQEKNFQAHR